MADYRGKKVTVMGLGRFGGGVGVVQFLASRGARVTVTDLRTTDELTDSLAELDGFPLAALHLGGHSEADFTEAELVVVNPAVPRKNRFLKIARDTGATLTSEMNLFWQHNRGKVVAITGSNGKSTTTALTHAMLHAGGVRCHLGGNVGISLLPVVDEIGPNEYVVLELSSFQLEDLARLRPQPDVAIVTNLSPNHLDRHGTLEAYRDAKQSLLAFQRPEQFTILNADDADVAKWTTRGQQLVFGESDHGQAGIFREGNQAVYRSGELETSLPLGEWLKLPGAHNFQNAMAAACCTLALGVSSSAIEAGLQNFQPLPHRLQLIVEHAGRRFYDDSIATTPESVAAALDAFSAPIVLLAGGYDKGVDLTNLARLIGERCKAVALMGQTAGTLDNHLRSSRNAGTVHRCCGSLQESFQWAVDQSTPGDVILLSPGCASYDWFSDYRERGHAFAKLTMAWRVGKSA